MTKLIIEQIRKADEETVNVLIEGINIDRINKTVTFDNSHEDNVDTSTIINPTYYTVKGHPVISIFKRKENEAKSDGNPLIYALKRINGWKIDKISIFNLLKKFIKITKKIKPQYDTIVVVESNSTLNKEFLCGLNKIIKAQNKIEDLFHKIPANDISMINFDGKSLSEEDAKLVDKKLMWMINYNNNVFEFKHIPKDLRFCIKKSIEIYAETDLIKYAKMINDKDVLVLDDTIASGRTVSEYCENLMDTFTPKSLTVITLFSPVTK